MTKKEYDEGRRKEFIQDMTRLHDLSKSVKESTSGFQLMLDKCLGLMEFFDEETSNEDVDELKKDMDSLQDENARLASENVFLKKQLAFTHDVPERIVKEITKDESVVVIPKPWLQEKRGGVVIIQDRGLADGFGVICPEDVNVFWDAKKKSAFFDFIKENLDSMRKFGTTTIVDLLEKEIAKVED